MTTENTPAPEKRKAGRPKSPPTKVIRIRLLVPDHKAVEKLGGDKWAKRVVLDALQSESAKSQENN